MREEINAQAEVYSEKK